MPSSVYTRLAKPALDRILAGAGLVVLSPVLVGVALVVRRRLGRPVVFRQVRPGLGGRPFEMLKFRTMTDARTPDGSLQPDGERLTPIGRFLRRTSLDELPGLVNVLRGEMSLVGPRPLLTRYLPYFTEREQARFHVLPGITGWAQVHGRNAVGWDARLACDVWYVENRSAALDARILWRTAVAVFRSEGVVEDPGAAMLDLDAERAGSAEPAGSPSWDVNR